MCYGVMAHVTDYDVWHVSEEPVTVEKVIAVLHRNTQLAQDCVCTLARSMPSGRGCDCSQALASAPITRPEVVPAATKEQLIMGKYLK